MLWGLFLWGCAFRVLTVRQARNLDLKARVKLGIPINLNNLKAIQARIPGYGLIVDALLGVGIKGLVKGIFADIITAINQSKAYVLSVDTPSGLDANTGRVLGKKLCGKIITEDIGFPL